MCAFRNEFSDVLSLDTWDGVQHKKNWKQFSLLCKLNHCNYAVETINNLMRRDDIKQLIYKKRKLK